LTPGDLLGGRVALWWAGVYTATPDPQLACERRDELRADLHDHLQQGLAEGVGLAQLSREMLGRSLRGAPADVVWRVEVEWARDGLRSLAAEPVTVLGALFVALLPITLLADSARRFGFVPEQVREVLTVVCGMLYTVAIAYALVAAGMRAVGGRRPSGRPLRRRLSRLLGLAMFASFALSGIWRFAPDPFGQISAWAWAVFGVTLVANCLALIVRAVMSRWRRKSLPAVSMGVMPGPAVRGDGGRGRASESDGERRHTGALSNPTEAASREPDST
jgi:hypothetical protein